MEIYVVQTGDTIDKIASMHGVTVEKLIKDNELTNPNQLVPGEDIIILTPSKTYTVQEGDSLETIAAANQITVNELLRNNPILSDFDFIYPGEILTISYDRSQKVATHGYTNTFINRNTLKKTLPYLTYLSVFNYRTIKNGDIMGTDDDMDIIQSAKEYGVIPLILITTLSVQGDVDIQFTYDLLTNEEIQHRLFDNIVKVVLQKGYHGVNISAQFINSSNQELFFRYAQNLSDHLRQEGLFSVITVNPGVEISNNTVTYEEIDYTLFTDTVASILFMQYKWGINTSPPAPLISIHNLNVFLDHTLTQVSADRIFVGIPTIGYLWELPYISGFSKSNSLSIESAINLARSAGVNIEFDEKSQTPYFQYPDPNRAGAQNVVWFINAVTINSLLKMILEKGISGTGVWNIMRYYTHLWLVINSQYEIVKLLPEF